MHLAEPNKVNRKSGVAEGSAVLSTDHRCTGKAPLDVGSKIRGRWLFLVGLVMAATVMVYGQSAPPAPAQKPCCDGPVRGIESKRWEPWSSMLTAAAPLLGWTVAISTDNFPGSTFADAIAQADALGLANVEASAALNVDMAVPKRLDDNLQPGEIREVQDKLVEVNIRLAAYRVPTIGPDEESSRKLFAFAKELGVETIVSDHVPGGLASIDKLANEYAINVAFCGSPQTVLAAVDPYSKRLGACGDTGSWLRKESDR